MSSGVTSTISVHLHSKTRTEVLFLSLVSYEATKHREVKELAQRYFTGKQRVGKVSGLFHFCAITVNYRRAMQGSVGTLGKAIGWAMQSGKILEGVVSRQFLERRRRGLGRGL